MTPADIIRLAEMADYPLLEFDGRKHVHAALLRMFKMAVSEEREACAKMCDEQGNGRKALEHYAALTYSGATHDCAAAIRARGNT